MTVWMNEWFLDHVSELYVACHSYRSYNLDKATQLFECKKLMNHMCES